MKGILLLLIPIILLGCESKEDVQSDIKELQIQRAVIEDINNELKFIELALNDDIAALKEDKNVLEMYQNGDNPRYLVSFELQQSRLSMDITAHMKDAMNNIKFELPVDRTFYNSVTVGERIVDEFRGGSFLMRGSLSSWVMKVKGKRIIKE